MTERNCLKVFSVFLVLVLIVLAGATRSVGAQEPDDPKVAAAAKKEKLTLKDVKIEGGALIVTGSTGLPLRRVTILNSPEPRIAVTSDRKGLFTIRRTDFRPDDCRLTIGVVSGTQTALVANCGPRGVAGLAGQTGPLGPVGPQGRAGADGKNGDTGGVGPAGPSGVVKAASVYLNEGIKTVEKNQRTTICELILDLSQTPSGSYMVLLAGTVKAYGPFGKISVGTVSLSRYDTTSRTELSKNAIYAADNSLGLRVPVGITHIDTVTGRGVYSYIIEAFEVNTQMIFNLTDAPCSITALAVRA